MRKVTAGLFSSIDGVVEAPSEWQPAFDEEMGAVLSRMLKEQDAVLLGRVTFTEWAGYWPASTDEPFASYINSTQKYVASTTLGSVGQADLSLLQLVDDSVQSRNRFFEIGLRAAGLGRIWSAHRCSPEVGCSPAADSIANRPCDAAGSA